jgi:hypothetical protein
MLDCIRDRFCPAGDLQLREDIADVGLHRCDGNDQGLGDLLVAISLHDQFQYFSFAFRQVKQRLFCRASGIDQRPGGFRGEGRSPRRSIGNVQFIPLSELLDGCVFTISKHYFHKCVIKTLGFTSFFRHRSCARQSNPQPPGSPNGHSECARRLHIHKLRLDH